MIKQDTFKPVQAFAARLWKSFCVSFLALSQLACSASEDDPLKDEYRILVVNENLDVPDALITIPSLYVRAAVQKDRSAFRPCDERDDIDFVTPAVSFMIPKPEVLGGGQPLGERDRALWVVLSIGKDASVERLIGIFGARSAKLTDEVEHELSVYEAAAISRRVLWANPNNEVLEESVVVWCDAEEHSGPNPNCHMYAYITPNLGMQVRLIRRGELAHWREARSAVRELIKVEEVETKPCQG